MASLSPRPSKKRRSRKQNPVNKLPEHLVPEILSWLPAKSLAKCKCVSKAWLALIQDHDLLVTMHHLRSIREPIRLQSEGHLEPWSKEQGVPEKIDTVAIVNGLMLQLFCPSMKLRVRNPLKGKILDLPNPPAYEVANPSFKVERPVVYFLYHPPSHQHKLLVFCKRERGSTEWQCALLTLGKDPNWREITLHDSIKHAKYRPDFTKTLDPAAVHFLSKQKLKAGGRGLCMEVHTFDIGSERFHVNRIDILPNDLFANPSKVGYCRWNRRFSLYEVAGDRARILVLEDYKKGKWRKEEEVHLKFLEENPHWRDGLRLRYGLPQNMIFRQGEMFFMYKPEVGTVAQLPSEMIVNGKIWLGVSPSLVEFDGMRDAASWDGYKPFASPTRATPPT